VIHSRFGGVVTLVRFATIGDVKTFERRKADKEDKLRTEGGWRFIARYEDGTEFLADVAYLRADEGLREILDTAFALPHPDPVPDWVAERLAAQKANEAAP
jgi:hypothetical protein